MTFTNACRGNPYAERIRREGYYIHILPGRPGKGAKGETSTTKSIRFPDSVWKLLAERAHEEGLALHAALRMAILAWARGDLKRTEQPTAKRVTPRRAARTGKR